MIERVGRQRVDNFARTRLRQAREELGWSQGRLAAELESSPISIAAWERGARAPEPPVLVRLAEVLGLLPDDLLTIPPDQWTLIDLRILAGLHQQAAAQALHIGVERLRFLEAGYQRLEDPTLLSSFAQTYGRTTDQVLRAWSNGRDRLLDS